MSASTTWAHPVADGRDAERPCAARRFRDLPPQHRLRPVAACAEIGLQLVEHPLDAVGLHRGQRHPIDTGRTAVSADAPPRLVQDVIPAHTVIQGVEAPLRVPLGGNP